MYNMGMWEWMVILFLLLLVFGAKRLPEMGRSLGLGIKEFKKSLTSVNDEEEEEKSEKEKTTIEEKKENES